MSRGEPKPSLAAVVVLVMFSASLTNIQCLLCQTSRSSGALLRVTVAERLEGGAVNGQSSKPIVPQTLEMNRPNRQTRRRHPRCAPLVRYTVTLLAWLAISTFFLCI